MAHAEINDLGGGLNQGQPAHTLKPNEFQALSNFYPFSTKLRRRGGMRRLVSIMPPETGRLQWPEAITGIYTFRPSTGTMKIMIASPTRIGYLQNWAFYDVTPASGFALTGGNARPWVILQYKDTLYFIRYLAGALVRFDGTNYGTSGISAPVTAPTIADGAAGAIPAANFYGVVTFYNPLTDVESNPSPASTVLAHAGSKKIDWSNIPVSGNPQVGARRLYRTLPDQTGEYYFVAEIDDNVTTTFTGDNVLVQDLGRAVSFSNGLPPTGLIAGDFWKERLFVTDGTDVFVSELGLAECFDPILSLISVFPDDGHVVRAIRAFGDRLIIGKTNKIHYLVGSDPSNFALLTLSDKHGCASHHSMQPAEGSLIWLGLDDFYRADGSSVTGIASVKLRKILDAADPSALRDAVATVYPALGWYVVVIPGVAELIYNYKTDAWTQVPTAAGMRVIGDYYDANFNQQILAADAAGWLYRFHDPTYGYDDNGTTVNPIAASFIRRPFDMPGSEGGARRDIIDRVYLHTPSYPETVDLSILASDLTTLKTRTGLPLDAPTNGTHWKVYALSTRQAPSSEVCLQLDYAGQTAIDVEAIAVDGESIGRYPNAAV